MTRKKGGFLTFCFSLLPGAGEMYMGFMKQGISLMTVFFCVIFMSVWLNLEPLLFLIPVIWFYSFFHVHNLRGMPDEEFYMLEDDYLFHFDEMFAKGENMDKKMRMILAFLMIGIGVNMLWNNLTNFIYWILPGWMQDYFHAIVRSIPQLIVGFGLVLLGIWLIRGKKRQLDEEYADQEEN